MNILDMEGIAWIVFKILGMVVAGGYTIHSFYVLYILVNFRKEIMQLLKFLSLFQNRTNNCMLVKWYGHNW